MNAPNDPRPTRHDLDRELRELLGEDDATVMQRAANAEGHARLVEQATRNISVSVAEAMARRSARRRPSRLIYLVPTLAAAAVAAFVWLMPDTTPVGQPPAPSPRSVVFSATPQPPAAMQPDDTPTSPVTQRVTTTPRHIQVMLETADERDNTLKNNLLDELASQNVVDGLARTTDTEAEGVTSITDTDIDHLLTGL